MSWSDEYLEVLRRDSSVCVPSLDLAYLAEQLGIPEKTLRTRRNYRDDVRKAEKEIIAGHLGRIRAEAMAGKLDDAQRAAQEEQEAEEVLDLPPILERYLEIYGELDNRKKALDQIQAEGVALSMDDVVQAMGEYPAFGRAMTRQWREGNVETEDKLRELAKKGAQAPLKMYLQGNMPEKYGNKLKVDVAVTHQLEAEDRHLVDGVKKDYLELPGGKRKALSAAIVGELVEDSL